MNKSFYILLFVFLRFALETSYAQTNLIPNGSFEVYDTCPNSTGQVSYATPWYSPTNASPDYFNQCAISASGVSVPSNIFGYEYARTGIAYLGFGQSVPAVFNLDQREYIQAPLTSVLIANRKYCVESYLSLGDSIQYGINGIGAYFSNTPVVNYSPFFYGVLSYQPQIVSSASEFLTDRNNWMLVSGSFIANGGESYITIGNFKNDANTDTLNTGTGNDNSENYYFIDDVSMYECEDVPNVFTPNNDNINDEFLIFDYKNQIKSITIYNRWGEIVFKTNDMSIHWKGKMGNTMSDCSAGTYYYLLELKSNEQKDLKTKGFIQLIR